MIITNRDKDTFIFKNGQLTVNIDDCREFSCIDTKLTKEQTEKLFNAMLEYYSNKYEIFSGTLEQLDGLNIRGEE